MKSPVPILRSTEYTFLWRLPLYFAALGFEFTILVPPCMGNCKLERTLRWSSRRIERVTPSTRYVGHENGTKLGTNNKQLMPQLSKQDSNIGEISDFFYQRSDV
jgi:hypothetical protein